MISETTLLYFFSTLSQSFAALTAFFFAAAQVRIAWIDDKITSDKKAILYIFNGTSHHTVNRVDAEMCKISATEVVKLGIERSVNGSEVLAERLARRIKQLQNLRTGVRNFVIIGISLTALGIIGILLSQIIIQNKRILISICVVLTFVILITLAKMGKFIFDSLEVTLKED